MKVTNHSVRDSVLVLWQRMGGKFGPSSFIIQPGGWQDLDDDIEILGTYKLVQVTKLVDDPDVVQVEEES